MRINHPFFALIHKVLKGEPLILTKQDLLNKGFQYFAERNYEKALIFFRKAIEIDGKFEAAYKALSETLNRMGRIDEAISIVHQWLEVNKNAPTAHYALSRLFVQKGWLNAAEKEMLLFHSLQNGHKRI